MKNAPVVVAVVVVLLALLRPSEGWLSSFAQPLTPSQGAHRQTRAEYTECFAAKLWTADGEDVNGGKLPKTVRVPEGWTVAGGTTSFQPVAMGGIPAPAMVLCREVASPAPKKLPAADPVGRCSSRDVSEMLGSGMSSSAIERACAP